MKEITKPISIYIYKKTISNDEIKKENKFCFQKNICQPTSLFKLITPVIRPKAPYLVKPKVQSPNNQMLKNKIRKKKLNYTKEIKIKNSN